MINASDVTIIDAPATPGSPPEALGGHTLDPYEEATEAAVARPTYWSRNVYPDEDGDGQGDVNVLAVGQTAGLDQDEGDYLYRICRGSGQEITTFAFPTDIGNVSSIELSNSKLVFVSSAGVRAVDFNKAEPIISDALLDEATELTDLEYMWEHNGVQYAGHGTSGYTIANNDGTFTFITKSNTARDDIAVPGGVDWVVPMDGSQYLVMNGEGTTFVDGIAKEVVRTVPGVYGLAVVPSSAEVDALTSIPPVNNMHIQASPEFAIAAGDDADTVVATLDTLPEGDAQFWLEFATAVSSNPMHTLQIFVGDAQIDLVSYGTAGYVELRKEGDHYFLDVEVKNDGRIGTSHIDTPAGTVTEHGGMTGQPTMVSIPLGTYAELFPETGDDDTTEGADDDDTVPAVDDDDTGNVDTGCKSGCDTANGRSPKDGGALVGGFAGLLTWAVRRRNRS